MKDRGCKICTPKKLSLHCIKITVYGDDGISGTNTGKRKGFNQMIEDCEAGLIDKVITKSISRFARNTVDCLRFTRRLKELNIDVFFEKDYITNFKIE